MDFQHTSDNVKNKKLLEILKMKTMQNKCLPIFSSFFGISIVLLQEFAVETIRLPTSLRVLQQNSLDVLYLNQKPIFLRALVSLLL